MRTLSTITLACLLAISFQACSRKKISPQAATVQPPTKITIAAITDFHGAIEPTKALSADGKTVITGGAANLSSHVRVLRNTVQGPLLLVDGGDLFQGTMESNLFEGSPVIRFYNYLGVTGAAVGNHEFDFGPVGDKAVPRDSGDDPRGALRERSREASFPLLAANMVDDHGHSPDWARPSLVMDVQGVRVGIIGAATMKTPETTNRLNLGGLHFTDPVPPVIAEARRLRERENAQVIVLTMHDGGGCDDNNLAKQDDLSSCTLTDVFEIVKNLPQGTVDVVVAGHTHRTVAKRIGRTVIMQALAHGQYLAWAEVDLSGAGKRPQVTGLAEVCETMLAYKAGNETLHTCDSYKLKKLKGEVVPARFLGTRMTPDPRVAELLKKEIEEVKDIKGRPLGVRAATTLLGAYGDESALGNLIADATRASLQGTDIGLANGGGVRAPLNAGDLTYGDLFAVLPFDNQLARMSVTGEELLRMIELGISGKQGALLWSGVTFRSTGCSVAAGNVLVNGEPLTLTRTYKIATSDYLAQGGSGMSSIGVPESRVEVFWDRPFILRDVVAQELPKHWKELRSDSFFDRANPRQKREGRCTPGATPALR